MEKEGRREGYITVEEGSKRSKVTDGGRGHEPRNPGSLQKLKRTRKWVLTLETSERNTALPASGFQLSEISTGC